MLVPVPDGADVGTDAMQPCLFVQLPDVILWTFYKKPMALFAIKFFSMFLTRMRRL